MQGGENLGLLQGPESSSLQIFEIKSVSLIFLWFSSYRNRSENTHALVVEPMLQGKH